MEFAGYVLVGFLGMEVFSYAVHRWLFHGVLWPIHKSHHTTRKGWFEANDLFSLLFAAVSIAMIVAGSRILMPLGIGIAVYGGVYFVVHDLFTHRRFLPFASGNRILLTIRAAHQRHHQTAGKSGFEPFGLFFFNYAKFYRREGREAGIGRAL